VSDHLLFVFVLYLIGWVGGATVFNLSQNAANKSKANPDYVWITFALSEKCSLCYSQNPLLLFLGTEENLSLFCITESEINE